MARSLTQKQQRFVEEYLIDLNATQAAIRAGYSTKNAGKIGFQLLEKTRIQEAIQEAMQKRSERTKATADQVLEEYAKLGFSMINDYLDIVTERVLVDRTANGEPISELRQVVLMKNTTDIPPEKLAAIAEVKQHRDGSISIKLHDKKGALDSMARHLGMFKDNIAGDVDITVTIIDDIE